MIRGNQEITAELSTIDRWSRALVLRILGQIQGGRIEFRDADGSRSVGPTTARDRVCITVHAPRFFRRLLMGGEIGAAESLMDGDWRCDDLTMLVRIMIRNLHLTDRLARTMAFVRHRYDRLRHWMRMNTRSGSVRNVARHYDLSNEFFQLFLDETLSYSSGLFAHRGATMLEASRAKFDRVGSWLQLAADDHVLEIGTGWGGLAITLAEQYGCRVTTATISREQHAWVDHQVRARGLAHRIDVRLQDYRDLRGQYDKLVSIEMVEAVGHQYLSTFVERCAELLKPDGLMFLQAIVIRDDRYARHIRGVDFIRKHIFPGGFLPSVQRILQAVGRASDFRLARMDQLGPHYARTLQHWRDRFWSQLDSVRQLGFDDRFVRMWDYYFCYCEAAFLECQTNLAQMLFAKPGFRDELPAGDTVRYHPSVSAPVSWAVEY